MVGMRVKTAQTIRRTSSGPRQLGVAVLAVFLLWSPVLADQYDDQIAALKAQIAQNQAQANSLQSQADTLNNKVAGLNAQIAQNQAQLQLSQTKYSQLNDQIAALEQKLAAKKALLGEAIRTLYLEAQVTPIEVLASSNNFSDYIDRQQYLQSIRSNVENTMADITALKAQAEQQRQEQSNLIAQQKALSSELNSQRNEVANLLAETKGQESAYQGLVSQNNQKLSAVVAARAAAIKSGQLKVSGGGCGSYPDQWCHAAQDSVQTIYGYPNRECTSYAAWRRSQIGKSLGGNWGNAGDWYANANDSGPHVGDVIVWPYGHPYASQFGHVAVVESVSSDSITFSQYNFDVGSGPGLYTLMTAPTNSGVLQGVGYIR